MGYSTKRKLLKTYSVSFVIRHPKKKLADLSKEIKLPFSETSCNRGDFIRKDRKAKFTVWKFNNNRKKFEINLNKTIENLINGLKRSALRRSKGVPKDWDAFLDIAVFYKTYTCSVEIQAKHLKWFSARNIYLSISCYPSS